MPPKQKKQRKTDAAGLVCDFCGRRFSRPSHHDRHYRTHLPPEGRLALPCAKCGKTFGRNDVLLRHLRTAHGFDPGPQPKAAQRSCYRCVQLRRKCDRAQPCRLCAAAGGAMCEYPLAEGLDASDRKQTSSSAQPAAVLAYISPQSTAQHQTPLMMAADDACRQERLFHGGGGSYPEHSHSEFDASIVAANGITNGCSPSFSDEYYLAADTTPFVASLSAAGQLDFRTAGLDWLDFDVPDIFDTSNASSAGILPEMDPNLANLSNPPAQPPPPPPPPPLVDRPPSSQFASLSVPGPPGGPGGAGGPNASSASPVLPWPFDYTPHDLAPHRYSLPPLREVLQTALLQSTNPAPPNTSVLANLVALMSDTRMPPLDDEEVAITDPGMAHAAHLLRRLVDTYVAKFQPILPLLHVPTWDLESCPPVLVSAMSCVGSLLSEDERVAGLTWSISELCMPMIAWLGSSDSANYRDIAYLSALCVHQIYSLGSGNRQLYQNADRSRGILVGGLRGMGCLTTRLRLDDELGQDQEDSTTSVDPAAQQAAQRDQWLAWVRREREKRTAWSSFEYDCSLCTLTGRRGAVDLSELPSRLPCAETLWDAPSAHAWAALRTRLHPDAQGAPVSRLLKAALSDGDDSESEDGNDTIHTQVSFWGKRLCAQVIGRLLWDLKQLETLSTSEYFGMPSLSTAQAANKVRLLRALDHLLVSMDQPTTVADLISYNIASLIGHYSHLYTAHDVLDIILYIVRNTVAHGAKLHKGIQMARRRLVATLSRDPPEARRLVYHAAQIVAVADDYLVSAPCEILRLFMGYTFLIVYAAYCPPPPPPGHHARQEEEEAPLRLDVPSHRIASTSNVDHWIAHGGPAAIGSVANIFAAGGALAVSRDAQAMLQRLKCWGLAEKFTKILQSFESTALVSSAA